MRLRVRGAEWLLLTLAACSGAGDRPRPASAPAAVKIGKPYQVFGKTYTPTDDRDYDERGIASWYGPGFHALSTANGESYDQDALTAAHKTLPMPSYVEVENLENGRKLTVRINDRGPFVAGRIIDLSRRAAQLLGIDKAGIAKVRVRRIFPDGRSPENASLAPGPALPTWTWRPASKPDKAPAKPSQSFVQVAALNDAGRIAWLSGYLTAFGTVVTEKTSSGLTRIRLGPYSDPAAANTVLAQVRAAGYTAALLVPVQAVP